MNIYVAAVNTKPGMALADCPHVYHVISQSKEFEEPSHHDISVCWWNTY